MAIYAIGDIHGNYDLLCRLLDNVHFSAADKVWFVGDIVNRGQKSLEVCRFIRELGGQATMVLGNHDIYLLTIATGANRLKPSDTLKPILDAPDGEEIIDWLRHRPLIHTEGNIAMIHAGLIPQWSVEKAVKLANELESAFQGKDYKKVFKNLFGNKPTRWKDSLKGEDRLRFIVNVLCRIRFCTPGGKLDFKSKGKPSDPPKGYFPWYAISERKSADHLLITGHWAALGVLITENHYSIDSGACWGNGLTAVRIDDRALFHVI